MGCEEEGSQPHENEVNQFGYGVLDWAVFKSGVELLSHVGEEEVRGRLRLQWPDLPRSGSALECAERLLLCEQKVRSAAAVLISIGGASVGDKLLTQRLESVRIPSEGTIVEKARRLLLVRTLSVQEMLRAAAFGFPADVAAIVCSLPIGQANSRKQNISAPAVADAEEELALEPWSAEWLQEGAALSRERRHKESPSFNVSQVLAVNELRSIESSVEVQQPPEPQCLDLYRQRRSRRLSHLRRLRERDHKVEVCSCCC